MSTYKYIVEVEASTRDEAETVLTERLNVDEDYGFPYTLGWYAAKDPVVEILTVRDPDASTTVSMFVNGESQYPLEEDVDPGAGHTQSDWDEYTNGVRADKFYSPAFKAAVLEARESFRTNHEYISYQERDDES